MSRATVDLQAVRFFLGYGLIFFFQHVLTIVSVTVVLFVVEWRLALIALAITPVIVAIAYRYSHVSHPVLRDVQQQLGEVATVAEEIDRRRPRRQVVRAGGTARRRSSSERPAAVFEETVRAYRQRALYVPLLAFLPLVAQAAVLLAAGRMVVDGSLSIGAFFTFNLLLAMLIMPLRMPRHVGRTGAARHRLRRAHLRGDGRARGRRRPAGCDRPAGRARHDPLRGRLVRLHAGPPRAGGDRARRRRGTHGRADRPHRLGQDDARLPRARASTTRPTGRDPRGRRRRARRHAPLAPARDRRHLAGSLPLLRDRAREHRLRRARRDRRAGRGGGAGRAGARVRRGAAAGLRHRDRRARHHALRRSAPAARDRTRAR